jgi:hypothetical protein
VEGESELLGDRVEEASDLYMEKVQGIVDEWCQILSFCHGQGVPKNFV